MPFHVGNRATLMIDRLTLGGEGVGRSDGMAVFVPYTAPGDSVEIEITEARPRFARGRLIRLLEGSADRVTPPCPYHFQLTKMTGRFCGGCSWQHLRYDAQLKAKRELVRETLQRIGGLKNVEVKPVLGMKDPWRYRNKVQQPVAWDAAQHRLVSGFFSPNSHELIAIDDCLVQPELSVAIVNHAKALLEKFRLRAYDAKSHQGWLRHLLVRTATSSQALLTFVTRTPDFPHEGEIVGELVEKFPQLAGVHQNVNPAATNVILGRQWRNVAGADFIEEHLGALRFRLSPGSFFQINTLQAAALYDETKKLAGRGERLIDLYCGVGGIALWLAGNFKEVGGIEEFAQAIEDAEANAELNGIENARFETALAERFLMDLDRGAGGPGLTVVVDPPRAGCSPDVLRALAQLRPGRIVYVSCDPGTLARDLGVLAERGYRVGDVQPVDLFPQTAHIETVVKLIL